MRTYHTPAADRHVRSPASAARMSIGQDRHCECRSGQRDAACCLRSEDVRTVVKRIACIVGPGFGVVNGRSTTQTRRIVHIASADTLDFDNGRLLDRVAEIWGRVGVPNGSRTRVSALKGPRPWPLDDGDAQQATPKFTIGPRRAPNARLARRATRRTHAQCRSAEVVHVVAICETQ